MASAAGLGLYWMWSEHGVCEMTLYSSVLAIAVAIFSVMEYVYLILRKSRQVKMGGHTLSQADRDGESLAQNGDADHSSVE